jgi:hypothetical protein
MTDLRELPMRKAVQLLSATAWMSIASHRMLGALLPLLAVHAPEVVLADQLPVLKCHSARIALELSLLSSSSSGGSSKDTQSAYLRDLSDILCRRIQPRMFGNNNAVKFQHNDRKEEEDEDATVLRRFRLLHALSPTPQQLELALINALYTIDHSTAAMGPLRPLRAHFYHEMAQQPPALLRLSLEMLREPVVLSLLRMVVISLLPAFHAAVAVNTGVASKAADELSRPLPPGVPGFRAATQTGALARSHSSRDVGKYFDEDVFETMTDYISVGMLLSVWECSSLGNGDANDNSNGGAATGGIDPPSSFEPGIIQPPQGGMWRGALTSNLTLLLMHFLSSSPSCLYLLLLQGIQPSTFELICSGSTVVSNKSLSFAKLRMARALFNLLIQVPSCHVDSSNNNNNNSKLDWAMTKPPLERGVHSLAGATTTLNACLQLLLHDTYYCWQAGQAGSNDNSDCGAILALLSMPDLLPFFPTTAAAAGEGEGRGGGAVMVGGCTSYMKRVASKLPEFIFRAARFAIPLATTTLPSRLTIASTTTSSSSGTSSNTSNTSGGAAPLAQFVRVVDRILLVLLLCYREAAEELAMHYVYRPDAAGTTTTATAAATSTHSITGASNITTTTTAAAAAGDGDKSTSATTPAAAIGSVGERLLRDRVVAMLVQIRGTFGSVDDTAATASAPAPDSDLVEAVAAAETETETQAQTEEAINDGGDDTSDANADGNNSDGDDREDQEKEEEKEDDVRPSPCLPTLGLPQLAAHLLTVKLPPPRAMTLSDGSDSDSDEEVEGEGEDEASAGKAPKKKRRRVVEVDAWGEDIKPKFTKEERARMRAERRAWKEEEKERAREERESAKEMRAQEKEKAREEKENKKKEEALSALKKKLRQEDAGETAFLARGAVATVSRTGRQRKTTSRYSESASFDAIAELEMTEEEEALEYAKETLRENRMKRARK